MAPVHYLAVGHVTQDLTPAGPTLGGTVAYAALTALGCGYAPGIFTACAATLDLSPLHAVAVERQLSPASTTYENVYTPTGRTQFLRARAAALDLQTLPAHWRAPHIVHLAPLAQELPLDLPNGWGNAFIGLTPQGWLRRWDDTGQVWTEPAPPAKLPPTNAIVLSIEDLRGDWALATAWAARTPVLVVTQGPAGCIVYTPQAEPRSVPGFRYDEVDPTGAGDVFAAAFFINLHETGDPYASARFANAVAGFSITRPGLQGVPDPTEISFCRIKSL